MDSPSFYSPQISWIIGSCPIIQLINCVVDNAPFWICFFTFHGFFSELPESGFCPLELFLRSKILFQLLDAVVPEHILPLVSLLVLFLSGFAVKTLFCRLFAGLAASFAAQIAAGIRGEEYPPALAAGTHDHAGIQYPLTVIDKSRSLSTLPSFKGEMVCRPFLCPFYNQNR